MKIVMTLLVKDEEDIVDVNLRFHYAMGVDFVIATDNASSDSTRDILAQYQREGRLHIIDEPDDAYRQSDWVTRMARMAADEYGADWILNNDADEFWLPSGSDYQADLDCVQSNVLSCSRHAFVPTVRDGDPNVPAPQRMTYMVAESHPRLARWGWYPRGFSRNSPKVMHRGQGFVRVEMGNHFVRMQDAVTESSSGIRIFHYPVRSLEQLASKAVNGASIIRNRDLHRSYADHWRRWNRAFRRGKIQKEWHRHLFTEPVLQKHLKAGRVVHNPELKRRLVRILESPNESP